VLAAEQKGGERGRQSQRVESGNGDRESDGQGELAEENAGGSGKKGDRHEDGDEHSDVAMTAPVTSFMASEAALMGLCSPSCKWRSMFSMTTMASSTTQAGGQGDAEQRERVDGEAQQLNEGERSDERDRDGDGGMMVERQSSRKTKMTRMTRKMAVPRVETTSRMDSPTASVVSKAISYFMPGGKRLARRSSSATHFW